MGTMRDKLREHENTAAGAIVAGAIIVIIVIKLIGAAEHYIGFMYANGIIVSQNQQEASEWFLASAEKGSADSKFNIAQRYENGIGITQSDYHAKYWYERAAAQGDKDAEKKLADIQSKEEESRKKEEAIKQKQYESIKQEEQIRRYKEDIEREKAAEENKKNLAAALSGRSSAISCELLAGMIEKSYSAGRQCEAIAEGAAEHLSVAMKLKKAGYPSEEYLARCANGIQYLKQFERNCPSLFQ